MESSPCGAGLRVGEYKSTDFKYQIIERDDKMVLVDKKGKTVLCCNERIPFTAMTCFALDDIDKKIQYTLAYTLMFMKL
jgi:hypothetical protein